MTGLEMASNDTIEGVDANFIIVMSNSSVSLAASNDKHTSQLCERNSTSHSKVLIFFDSFIYNFIWCSKRSSI